MGNALVVIYDHDSHEVLDSMVEMPEVPHRDDIIMMGGRKYKVLHRVFPLQKPYCVQVRVREVGTKKQ